MTAILVARLQLTRGVDLALNADILQWMEVAVTNGKDQRWLQHTYGLTGHLTGALALADDLFPGLRWNIQAKRRGSASIYDAAVLAPGAAAPQVCRSGDAANALLGATLLAFAAVALPSTDREAMAA
ncbi:hypothetical protein [Aureimonas sp. ME7]|uniref:hypothetical protein n=1 Tax=Aureimonas sp. ME7 TaxID=2744252 RepID=UPI0015FA9BFD|nr:hypothetical protein [Aureimonas sp. ME7]